MDGTGGALWRGGGPAAGRWAAAGACGHAGLSIPCQARNGSTRMLELVLGARLSVQAYHEGAFALRVYFKTCQP